MFQLFVFIFIIQQCFHGFLFEYFTASIKSCRMRVFGCQIVEQFNFLQTTFKNLTTNVSVKKCTNLFSCISFQYTFFYRVTVKRFSKKRKRGTIKARLQPFTVLFSFSEIFVCFIDAQIHSCFREKMSGFERQ